MFARLVRVLRISVLLLPGSDEGYPPTGARA